jgi:hypothetical protein
MAGTWACRLWRVTGHLLQQRQQQRRGMDKLLEAASLCASTPLQQRLERRLQLVWVGRRVWTAGWVVTL